MPYEFCTFFDLNYLPRGLALYRSLEQVCPSFRLRVFCMDPSTKTMLDQMHLEHLVTLSIAELEAWDPELLTAKAGRTQVEYCWTTTPLVCLYALEHEPELASIIYLDADLAFFQDPAPLLDALGSSSVLLVPHQYPPELEVISHTRLGSVPEFKSSTLDAATLEEHYGIYNVGFIAFRRSDEAFAALRWWRQRCLEWCFDRVEDGRWGDQKYLDDWPQRFRGVRVLENPGVIAAPWNTETHTVERSNGSVFVDGKPLILYHHATLRLYRGITVLRFFGLLRNAYHVTRNAMPPLVWTSEFRLGDMEKSLIWDPYLRRIGQALHEVRGVDPGFRAGFVQVDPRQLLSSALRRATTRLVGRAGRIVAQVRRFVIAQSARPTTSYEEAVLADSPAAYWRLGDGSGSTAADASGNENIGTYAGGVILGAPALITDTKTTASFDGNEARMYFPAPTSLTPTTAISLEAWIQPDAVPTAPGSAWNLVAKWNTALLYLRGGADPKFVFALYDDETASYLPAVASTTTVAAASTYHVVGTYDGTKLRIYVNGIVEGKVPHSGPVNESSSGGALAPGGWGSLPTPAFQGRLAEIAIYGMALSIRQIQTHYITGARQPR